MLDNNIFEEPIYGWDFKKKNKFYLNEIKKLTFHHAKNCQQYKNILQTLHDKRLNFKTLNNFPFIPVKLFKYLDLMSIEKKNVFKTMRSSGTTTNQPSVIFLDKINATNQTKVLTKIVTSFIGNKRLPLLVIDAKSTIISRNNFSARGAAIIGFSLFGKDITYALNDDLSINHKAVGDFYQKYKNNKILIFGFTYLLYKNFLKKLSPKFKYIFHKESIVIHGGGWKKMYEEAITNLKFKSIIKKNIGINNVHNYYGLIEQTGSIFFECEYGFLHSSIYSDIMVRSNTIEAAKNSGKGIVQLLSPLATSYPGHNILTEDLGTIVGIDDCKCGRKGKYFTIDGRLKNAEIRGCSDTR